MSIDSDALNFKPYTAYENVSVGYSTTTDSRIDTSKIYIEAERRVKALEDENAELRELVRHLYTCMERQEPDGSLLCANCPYENESNECDYELRMEELGVEL